MAHPHRPVLCSPTTRSCLPSPSQTVSTLPSPGPVPSLDRAGNRRGAGPGGRAAFGVRLRAWHNAVDGGRNLPTPLTFGPVVAAMALGYVALLHYSYVVYIAPLFTYLQYGYRTPDPFGYGVALALVARARPAHATPDHSSVALHRVGALRDHGDSGASWRPSGHRRSATGKRWS